MKKLFPSILLSPIIITPVLGLTSCGSNYVEQIDMIDMLKPETWPSVTPLESSGKMTQKEAVNFYIKNLQSNPQQFIPDMVHGASEYVNRFQGLADPDKNVILKEFELGFTQPEFGTTYICHIGSRDEEVNTISFKQRVHIVYEQDLPEQNIHLKQDIVLNVDYQNVLFCVYESINNQWNVGIMDQDVGVESCWYYQYNLNPWSVSYSCVNTLTKTVKGSEGTPDIDIHNAEYYSGNIDSASKLYYTYLYTQPGFTPTPIEMLDVYLIQMVLMYEYESTLLDDVDREIDIRLFSPLYAETFIGVENVSICGFVLFAPKADDVSESAKATVKLLTKDRDGNDIVLKENEEVLGGSKIELQYKEEIVPFQHEQYTRYTLPGKYYENANKQEDVIEKNYIIPVDSLKFNVKYELLDGTIIEKDIEVNLHYRSLTLTIKPQQQN